MDENRVSITENIYIKTLMTKNLGFRSSNEWK